MRAGMVIVVVLAGCGPVSSTTGSESADADTTTANSGASGPATIGSTTTSTTGQTSASAGSSDDGSIFLEIPDGGSDDYACDVWTGEPCGPGEKCMPYDNAGGSSWNATKCNPVAPDPKAPGEPCTVEGNGVSGIDDCEAFSMCWYVDPETNMGRCVAFCVGSAADPTCVEPCTTCSLTSSGVLILCLPNCDPLLQNCARGHACYPLVDTFGCVPDASGRDMGVAGDPCEYLNVCDPGLFCANADVVEGCEGSQGCCAPFCPVGASDPCAALSPDVECVPFFEDPPPLQCQSGEVGVCIVPQ